MTACPRCAAGKGFSSAGDCQSAVCTNASCQTATCADATKNGGESDVDYGGEDRVWTLRNGQIVCGHLGLLERRVHRRRFRQAPTCGDATKNGGRDRGVEAGGATACGRCAATKSCTGASDCQSDVCTSGKCQAPTCGDTRKNGAETDVDCGGGTCPKCAATQVCGAANDCQSGVCTANVCQSPTCADQAKNGTESDVDCGGSCSKCAATKVCGNAGDCLSGVWYRERVPSSNGTVARPATTMSIGGGNRAGANA